MSYHNLKPPQPRPGKPPGLFLLAGLAIVTLAVLDACGGGGGSGSGSVPAAATSPVSVTAPAGPSPTPTSATPAGPSPTPTSPAIAGSAIAASPSSLAFQSLSDSAQTVAVTQAQNSTGFSLSTTTCNKIASVAAASGQGPFVFTPVGAGACNYTVTGAKGLTATIAIVVTTTTLTTQGAQRLP